MVPFLIDLFFVFCYKSSAILSKHCTKDHLCSRIYKLFLNWLFYMLTGNECKHLCMLPIAMSLTGTCKFSTSTITPHLLPSWFLPQPLVDLHVYEHINVSSITCNWFFICALACNCDLAYDPTYDLAFDPAYDRTCECVLAYTLGYEFPPASKRAPTCKNHPENDDIAPKLHNTRCSLLHKKAATSFNHHNVSLTSQFSNCWFITINKTRKGQESMIWIIFYQHVTTFTTTLSHIDK